MLKADFYGENHEGRLVVQLNKRPYNRYAIAVTNLRYTAAATTVLAIL